MGLEPVATAAALVLQELIVQREAADEHADVGTSQPIGGYPPVFERLPGGLQQKALLGSREWASRGEMPKNWGSN